MVVQELTDSSLPLGEVTCEEKVQNYYYYTATNTTILYDSFGKTHILFYKRYRKKKGSLLTKLSTTECVLKE